MWFGDKPSEFWELYVGNFSAQNKDLLAKWLWDFPCELDIFWYKVIVSNYR